MTLPLALRGPLVAYLGVTGGYPCIWCLLFCFVAIISFANNLRRNIAGYV